MDKKYHSEQPRSRRNNVLKRIEYINKKMKL